MQTLLTDNLTYLRKIDKNIIAFIYDIQAMNEQSLKMLSDYFQTSIDYLCFEDLTKISKKERLDNYLLIQKRLKK
tara:strand:+ start:412 stop:636 length:225 start_codon:yes stop_codon:yes gene_type:complete